MSHLTANDLKTRGVAAIEAVLAERPEVMISVRGKERYVVMDLAHYQHLRECELDAALAQSRADLAAGRYVQESAQDHVARLGRMLAAESAAPAYAAGKSAPVRVVASSGAWRKSGACEGNMSSRACMSLPPRPIMPCSSP